MIQNTLLVFYLPESRFCNLHILYHDGGLAIPSMFLKLDFFSTSCLGMTVLPWLEHFACSLADAFALVCFVIILLTSDEQNVTSHVPCSVSAVFVYDINAFCKVSAFLPVWLLSFPFISSATITPFSSLTRKS